MKTCLVKNLFYLISLGYVFLGVCFLDWSFKMVPFGKDAPLYDIFVVIVINNCFIVLGILLYIATFLAVRKKTIASIVYHLSFWIGVVVLSIIAILLTILVMLGKISSFHIGDVVMYCVLYVPFMLVYFNRKRLDKCS